MAPGMKRARKVNPVTSRVKVIKGGIQSAEGCSKNVKDILTSTLDVSVGALKANRHPFNERLVAMTGEVLDAEHARLKQDVVDKERAFEEMSPQRAAREAALEEAKTDAAAKAEALAAAKTAAADVVQPLKEAGAALKEAEKAQKAGDATADGIAAQKAAIEEMQKESLAPLLQSTSEGEFDAEATLKRAKAVLEAGKSLDLDASLLSTAEPVLEKAAGERGSFDAVCLERLEAAFNGAINGLNEKLAAEEPGKAERAAAVANAQAAKQALETQQADLKEKRQAAQEAKSAADAASKAAGSNLENFMPDLKKTGDALDKARTELTEFAEGALQAYSELKDLKEGEGVLKEPEPVAEEAPEGSPEKRARTEEGDAAPAAA